MPTDTSQLWTVLTAHIRAVKPSLERTDLRPEASLTGELGLDSLDLVQLSARITSEFPEVDLTPWLTQACRPGMDTLAAFVSCLEDQVVRIPAVADAGNDGSVVREERTC